MSNIVHFSHRSLAAPMLFASLTETVQRELRDKAMRKRFEEGALIHQRGDDASGFWLLESGSVAVGQFLPDGEFRAAAVLGAGDSWGELAMFSHRHRVVDAIARTASEVAFVRAVDFEAMLEREPAIMRSLLSALSAQLQEMLDVVASIRKGTATPRIASVLVNLAGSGTEPKAIAITQQELGELLGLSRATINAELRAFEQAGILSRNYGKITIKRPESLRLLAIGD
jgi:CRP-like cAMP-binding protein